MNNITAYLENKNSHGMPPLLLQGIYRQIYVHGVCNLFIIIELNSSTKFSYVVFIDVISHKLIIEYMR